MTLSASHAAFSDPNRGEALLPCPFCAGEHVTDRYVRDGRQMFCIGCGASVAPSYHGPNNDTLERARKAWNSRASVGESTIWIVKVWNADGTDSDEYVFNTKADYDRFLKDKPAQLDISDIHERTVTNAAEALEHASELAATPILPSAEMESGK